MTVSALRTRYTYADFCALPEDHARRYELMDGDLHMVPAPTVTHQRVLRRLLILMNEAVSKRELGEVFCSPIDVVFGEGDARDVCEPDLLFVANARRALIKPHGIEGAPDLVVEIISPSTESRDRGYKLTLYARYGAREYWIVDPQLKTIDVYSFEKRQPAVPMRVQGDSQLTSALLPDSVILLRDVFQDER